MTVTDWDRYFIDLAYAISKKSKDPSTQVGAIIVRPDNTIAATGFNGFPRGMSDDPVLYADRDVKYSRVVHGEMNAILMAREPLLGYTLYTTPFFTCDRCAVHVIQAGIKRVVSLATTDQATLYRHGSSWDLANRYYREAGVLVELF